MFAFWSNQRESQDILRRIEADINQPLAIAALLRNVVIDGRCHIWYSTLRFSSNESCIAVRSIANINTFGLVPNDCAASAILYGSIPLNLDKILVLLVLWRLGHDVLQHWRIFAFCRSSVSVGRSFMHMHCMQIRISSDPVLGSLRQLHRLMCERPTWKLLIEHQKVFQWIFLIWVGKKCSHTWA